MAPFFADFCRNNARRFDMMITQLIVLHSVASAALIYKEIYECNIGTMARIMKGVEVFCSMWYIGVMVQCLDCYNTFFYFNSGGVRHPPCADNEELIKQWTGNSSEWFFMEIIVFVFYFTTMIILMIRSRFTRVGID